MTNKAMAESHVGLSVDWFGVSFSYRFMIYEYIKSICSDIIATKV